MTLLRMLGLWLHHGNTNHPVIHPERLVTLMTTSTQYEATARIWSMPIGLALATSTVVTKTGAPITIKS